MKVFIITNLVCWLCEISAYPSSNCFISNHGLLLVFTSLLLLLFECLWEATPIFPSSAASIDAVMALILHECSTGKKVVEINMMFSLQAGCKVTNYSVPKVFLSTFHLFSVHLKCVKISVDTVSEYPHL